METIMNTAFAAFAIYGIYVLLKWKRAADAVVKMCEEMKEEIKNERED